LLYFSKYLTVHYCSFFLILKFIIKMQEIQNQIQTLKNQLTGNMMLDMDTRDKIHNLKMKLKGSKPESSEIDCVGCGS